jgi:hypothetical protein
MALTYNRTAVYTLAKHLGTSVAMIEQHYGHVELRKMAHEIFWRVRSNAEVNFKIFKVIKIITYW